MKEFKIISNYLRKLTKNNVSSLDLNDDVFFSKKNKLVVSVDTYNQKIHFFDFKKPYLVIKKVLRGSISDIVSKGVFPNYYFLSASLKKNSINNKKLNEIVKSLKEEQKLFKGINSSKLNYLFKNKNNYERILIFEAKVNNKILSQVCIFLHGQTATYLASWQKNTELKINLTAVLLWYSVKYLKNININFLDLGGINLDIFDGISFFKKGMGGKRYYLVSNILKI